MSLPKTASTVIVGGGVIGAAAAHFLADHGEADVLLLERAMLGSGPTGRLLGGVLQQRDDELAVRMATLATTFWREFSSFSAFSAWYLPPCMPTTRS